MATHGVNSGYDKVTVVFICIVAGNVLPAPAGTATAAPAAPSQPVTTTQSLPNVSDIQMQRAYAALGLPYTGSPSPQSGHQQGGLNIRPPGSNSPGIFSHKYNSKLIYV